MCEMLLIAFATAISTIILYLNANAEKQKHVPKWLLYCVGLRQCIGRCDKVDTRENDIYQMHSQIGNVDIVRIA
jgi:hypothetical protein